MNQQSKWLQQQYHDIGATLAEQSPVALLHIGSQQTLVMISEPSVLTLPLGANKTAADYFSHSIPKADEMENAISLVIAENFTSNPFNSSLGIIGIIIILFYFFFRLLFWFFISK